MDLTELERIFLGEAPWSMTLEIILRTSFMFLYALLLLRLTGKRGQGQLSPFEYAIIIALGSAVGDPMFYPNIPLLHGMVVISVIIGLQRGLARITEHNDRLEAFVEGAPELLVKESKIVIEGLEKEDLSKNELFAQLRQQGVEQLGQVKRAYIEPTGRISIFLYPPSEIREGLPLYPPGDDGKPNPILAGAPSPSGGTYACQQCGASVLVQASEPIPACQHCGGDRRVAASKTGVRPMNAG